MRIGIDAMGGDFAPKECIKAVLEEASVENFVYHFFIFGVQKALSEYHDALQHSRITVIHTGDSIGIAEHATKTVAAKN